MWPLSRSARPKPLLRLTGERTMLQLTALRFAGEGIAEEPVVVAHESHGDEIARQLEQVGIRPAAMILEPEPRSTAAAIALATLAADESDLLLVMPSDHLIERPEALAEAVRAARGAAEQGWLVTFGIVPATPHTGYGYIERGTELGSGVYSAARFEEKPERAAAEAFLASGRHYWNAGIFLFRAGAMLEALRRHAPDILDAAGAAMALARREGYLLIPEAAAFRRSPSISIDYAVMERAGRVAVVPVDAGWSDLGSWEALYQQRDKDGYGNAVAGDAILRDASGCLVIADGLTVAALGVEDLVIVATADAVLVARRDRSEEVKVLVEALKARGSGAVD